MMTAYPNLHLSTDMTNVRVASIDGPLLASLLLSIHDADAAARMHDERGRAGWDEDECAEAGERADGLALRGRKLARSMIEAAFPGVTWEQIERAAL